MNKVYIMNEAAFRAWLAKLTKMKCKQRCAIDWYWHSCWIQMELWYEVTVTNGAL